MRLALIALCAFTLIGCAADVQRPGVRDVRDRYDDLGVQKLLHVVFDHSGRVASYAAEWDPSVYSRID